MGMSGFLVGACLGFLVVLRFGQIFDDVVFFVVKVCMLIFNFSGTIHQMLDTYEIIC